MKEIVCQQPNKFLMRESNYPSRSKGEAIVRVHRVGICGTDLHAYQGNQPYFTYPRVLGHELSGVIEEVDNNNQGLEIGTQVSIVPYLACGHCIACRNGKTNCCVDMKVIGVHKDGGMTEYISIPVENLIITDGLTLDQAAVAEPLAIGAHAVRRAKLTEGEWVLVIGAGPIGTGVMTLAKQAGAKVIAMDISKDRLDFCKQWANVDEVVDASEDPLLLLLEITEGDLPAVVFDATGNKQSMSASFQYVSHGGKLVFVGLVKDTISFDDPEFHKKELTLMGSRNATIEDFHTVIDYMYAGKVDVNHYITHRSHLEHMIQSFDQWLLPESKVIKAIVEL